MGALGAGGLRAGMVGARTAQLRAGDRVATVRRVSATAAAQSDNASWRMGLSVGSCDHMFDTRVL